MQPRWKTELDCYIPSLSLGYHMNEDDIKKMWEAYESKSRNHILPNKGESFEDFMIRFVNIFYVIAIKALNLYIFNEEDIDIERWFNDYLESQFYYDLLESLWFDLAKDPDRKLAEQYSRRALV